ncbi:MULTISPECIES: WecB/TagA/CpsF family glycosyltransferase [Mycolicibacterium]|uniref:WecB/TagA/CpsF family glycosyltransferase n=1 Tax=Mycolicibacterium TaxID=1866885 RepID=UPI0013A57219|nr:MULTISPECIES: WecB/TagA/CpsF family glycosyltransferase [Mycolicibacterium]QZH62695.1 WecB/TagA/CpsF family glycosyltransferase [Mycolicibacterium farcinogenes]
MLTLSARPTMRIGATSVARCSTAEVIALVTRHLGVPDAPALALGSVNLDHLHHFRAGRTALGGAGSGPEWLWLADGAPVAWRGSRLTGTLWPRVTGADLLDPLLDECVLRRAQVGFFGGQPDTHRRLAEVWAYRYPQAPAPLFWAPSRREVECPRSSAELAAEIRAAGVRVLIVGLGKPRQELWIDRHGAATGAAVLAAFGAAADFLAGVVNRAPERYRRHGMEWLYRLNQEPRRLARRYLVQGPPAFAQLRHAVVENTEPDAFTRRGPGLPGERP